MHKRCISPLGFMFLFCFVVRSQQPINFLFKDLQERMATRPIELIYLQTSKSIYETGEDLWFKAYQLDAQSFGLSNKSKTLYLQMINLKDSVVWQEKYLFENGIVSGHVYVDEKLPEGDYFLEGYSKHSFYKNDTTSILSARKIRVIKNISRTGISALPTDTTFRFEIFPEGGNLVCGVLSKIACKATDGKGNPVDVEGVLYQDDEPIINFKSIHNGMSTILLAPLDKKKYRIELTNGNSYPLPEIYPNGMAIRLHKHNKEQIDFIVSQSEGQVEQQIYLMGQMRGMICCTAKAVLKDNMKITIPLDNFLYQGIAEFTLFNQEMQPIAERLVYIHPKKKLHIALETDKKTYTIREKATIQIKVTDEQGKPVRTNLGVSVYDQAYNNPADPVNIITQCYLSSQIRGKIYNPAYYFDEENKERTEALDLLLLTQGWRRYIWSATDSISHGQMLLTDEINGIQIIESKKKGHQNQDSDQLIQVSGPEGNSAFIWADSTGYFTVEHDLMKELRGGYVYLKPMLSNEFKPLLQIDNFFPKIASERKKRIDVYPYVNLSQPRREIVFKQPVTSLDSIILLDEVTVTGKGRKPFRDKVMGRLDSLAQMNLGPWVCKHGWLENYREGYTHHHDPRYCPCPTGDEEPRTQPIIGKRYHISKYEYFTCNSSVGWCFKPIDSQWIIYKGAIYSEEELLRMNNLWRTKGYYTNREFYQPDELEMQSAIPDARNTLLWQPSVITDEKGEATVSFYCSDINTGFIGLVEGVDGIGLLGSTKCEFRVIRR